MAKANKAFAKLSEITEDESMSKVDDIHDLLNPDIVKFPIITISVTAYCQVVGTNFFLPGELAIAAFDLRGLVWDTYTTFIDPGEVPKGCKLEVRNSTTERGLEYPGFNTDRQDIERIVFTLLEFVKRYSSRVRYAPLFCFEQETYTIYGSLDWMYAKVGLSPRRDPRKEFRLWPIETLLYKVSILGLVLHAREDDVGSVDELEEVKSIREGMIKTFGVGDVLAPAYKGGYFYTKFREEMLTTGTPEERMWAQTGKFCNVAHAREYLRGSISPSQESLACGPHRQVATEKDYRIFRFCSLMTVNRVRARCLTALEKYFGTT